MAEILIKYEDNKPKEKNPIIDDDLYYKMQAFLFPEDYDESEEPNKVPISKKEFKQLMKTIASSNDCERAHMAFDIVMVSTLQALGYDLSDFINRCKYYV